MKVQYQQVAITGEKDNSQILLPSPNSRKKSTF